MECFSCRSFTMNFVSCGWCHQAPLCGTSVHSFYCRICGRVNCESCGRRCQGCNLTVCQSCVLEDGCINCLDPDPHQVLVELYDKKVKKTAASMYVVYVDTRQEVLNGVGYHTVSVYLDFERADQISITLLHLLGIAEHIAIDLLSNHSLLFEYYLKGGERIPDMFVRCNPDLKSIL